MYYGCKTTPQNCLKIIKDTVTKRGGLKKAKKAGKGEEETEKAGQNSDRCQIEM